MYRINLIAMIILSVAVVATGAFLALEKKSAADTDQERVQKLIRNLTNPDPDVRRESEAELKKMGIRVADPLRDAAKSEDRPLAERAKKILSEIEGDRAAASRTVSAPEKKEEPAAEIEKSVPGIEVTLAVEKTQIRSNEIPRFYVTLINRGAVPVVIAREKLNGLVSYAKYSRFEIVDKSGSTIFAAPEAWTPAAEFKTDAVVLGPGATLNLYAGVADSRTTFATRLARGEYRIRFAYDASAGSPYRSAVTQLKCEGSPLPLEKFASNEIALAVAE